jgi:predicted ATPase
VIIERVALRGPLPADTWPFTLAPVRQLTAPGLELDTDLTFLVGENGSGKSTLIEAIAEAYGMDVRGGHGARKYAPPGAKGPLGEALELRLGREARGRQGFFLRAETAHGVFEFMSEHGVPGYGEKHLGEVSHGEGYLQVLEGRFVKRGLYLLDEPEAPLSFESSLVLVRVLHDAVRNGSQVICATHSPLLTAIPGARIVELTDAGMADRAWEDLEIVTHWRRYLSDPRAYLRHVLD